MLCLCPRTTRFFSLRYQPCTVVLYFVLLEVTVALCESCLPWSRKALVDEWCAGMVLMLVGGVLVFPGIVTTGASPPKRQRLTTDRSPSTMVYLGTHSDRHWNDQNISVGSNSEEPGINFNTTEFLLEMAVASTRHLSLPDIQRLRDSNACSAKTLFSVWAGFQQWSCRRSAEAV